MDQIVVNIGSGEAYNGDEVVLIGKQGNEVITAADLAAQLGTISYEVLTSISQRVPRIYVNEQRPGGLAQIMPRDLDSSCQQNEQALASHTSKQLLVR
jgi:alanine racemase